MTGGRRRDPAALVAVEDKLRTEIRQLHRKLAELSGVSEAQWNRRTARIERRVEQLAENVNRRRREKFVEQTSTVPDESPLGVVGIVAGLFAPPEQLPPVELIVAEQTSYHRVADELSPQAAEQILRAGCVSGREGRAVHTSPLSTRGIGREHPGSCGFPFRGSGDRSGLRAGCGGSRGRWAVGR